MPLLIFALMKHKENIHFGAICSAVLTFVLLWPSAPTDGTLRELMQSLIAHLSALGRLVVEFL